MKEKTMKKTFKILIILLIVITCVAAGLLIWQSDNISSLISGLSSSSEELAAKMDDQRNKLKTEVEKYVSRPIEDISAEDEKKLIKGEITVEEIADKYNLPLDYMKDADTSLSEGTTNNPQDASNEVQPDSKAIDKAISEGVSKMYALKAKYVNKLGEVERAVLKEYKNLPKEKQNKDGKYKILMDNLDSVAKLEKKCDDEVAKVLSDLEEELESLNGDTEIVKILREAYKQEKEIKKSYYLSMYNN
jgi:vacuolar-type H+-ATPase subunit I/STV1